MHAVTAARLPKRLASSVVASVFILLGAVQARAETLASPWVEGFNNKVRLLAGSVKRAAAAQTMAGVEISMPPGWKTYWQAPGDAGGIPPEFDWTGSENLGSAVVRFPVPHRLVDKAGAAIGYKDQVLFPVDVTAKDKTRPVSLKLKVSYGACKDICIPAEAELALDVPPDAGEAPEIAAAVAKVPVVAPYGDSQVVSDPSGFQGAKTDPSLIDWRIDTASGKPKLIFSVSDPGGSGGDAFLSGPEGVYLPLPNKVSDEAGKATYEANLSDGVDIKDLKGKLITVTLAGTTGQSAFLIRIP